MGNKEDLVNEKIVVCIKAIDRYFEVGNLNIVADELGIHRTTINFYINRHKLELETNYPDKMNRFYKMKKECAKRRKRKKRIKVEEYRTDEKSVVLTNDHLKSLPKEIKYNKFIDYCAAFKTQKSVNKLIEEASKIGVKVVL